MSLSNVEAEAALIGAMLLENSIIDAACDIVESHDFAEPVHARLFDTILDQHAQGRAANGMTLRPYVEHDEGLKALGGMAYLAHLCGDGQGLLAPFDLARQVRELSQRRHMQEGLRVACDACGDLDATTAEIIAHADAALDARAKDSIHQPTGGECIDELLASFANRVPGVTCGVIPCLDELLGSMRPKQLVIGAGRPGMGKTALALSYAIGAARQGHGVLFVSLEMSSTELAARMVADLCFNGHDGVPYSAIRDGNTNDYQAREIGKARDAMHRLPFHVVDAGQLTVGRLNTLIRRHARKMAARGHKLELVIVDYLQLLSSDTRGRSNYETVSEVSRSLKAMAKDHGVAMFALAQLSREVEKRPDKRPQLSDLRDSGQIEQDADAVLFLMRPEYYHRQTEPEKTSTEWPGWNADLMKCLGLIEFILAKRRNGVTGAEFGEFHGAYQAVRG